MEPTRVILADDHAILRYGLRIYLSQRDDIEIVGEASTGSECVQLFKEQSPDVSVIDIAMPEKNGIEVTHAIRAINPNAKVLILSMHTHEDMVRQALNADINGYLVKNSPKKQIADAISDIHQGKKVFSDSLPSCVKNPDSKKPSRANRITRREREILHLVVEGYSSPQIAEKLYISPRTVDTHRNNLMRKLDIKNAASLVRYAMEHNMLDDSSTPPSSAP